MVVTRHADTIEVFQNGPNRVFKAPIGVGTADTPTPGGKFYIKESSGRPTQRRLRALRLRPVRLHRGRVAGQLQRRRRRIGIHGTDEPQLVGTDVSHGCIRLYNADITRLTKILPLGTPVEILA